MAGSGISFLTLSDLVTISFEPYVTIVALSLISNPLSARAALGSEHSKCPVLCFQIYADLRGGCKRLCVRYSIHAILIIVGIGIEGRAFLTSQNI